LSGGDLGNCKIWTIAGQANGGDDTNGAMCFIKQDITKVVSSQPQIDPNAALVKTI
jgi:hypothetical protein